MGNLGFYQTLTTWSKRVGGPKKLVVILLISGGVIARVGEAGIKKGVKAIKGKITKRNNNSIDTELYYDVIVDGKDNNGLVFCIGDKYKVLERDGDSVLIEKLGDINNPYFVSCDFLTSISDYK